MKPCQLPLDGGLNTFESDLSGWTIVVFAVTTVGLLFYHMTQEKTLPMEPEYASLLAIVFLLCAIMYIVYALYNFYQRTSDLYEKANECSKKDINASKLIYSFVTFVICIALLFVSYRIYLNTKKNF